MKNLKLLYVAVGIGLFSCAQADLEEDITVVEKTSERTNAGEPRAIKSNCRVGNAVAFDAPVNNNLSSVNLAQQGMDTWQLVDELSDEFDYPGGKTASVFNAKWKLGFVNKFTGPLPTVWTGNQVSFETLEGDNRALVLEAKAVGSGRNRTLECGMLTSIATSSYPMFQEVRAKISSSQLANAIWMVSNDPGTTEEIDNLEAYGPRKRPDGSLVDKGFFADRIHLSHHTFATRNGSRADYQPQVDTWMSRKKSDGNCSRDNEVVWSDDYHYFGVKWESPTKLEYFIDGELVKVVEGLRTEDGIDPEELTSCGEGLTREMHMLISQASQTWRYGSAENFWASKDIKTGPLTKFRVDWMRVYTPTGELNKKQCN